MTIQSVNIVYLIAPSGTGKSFTGDYLSVIHGYKHVDGDGPLKNAHLPQYKEMMTKAIENGVKYQSKDEDGPKELWSPHYEELAKLTLEAANDNDKVVLSHATYRQSWRNCVVEKLVEGGIQMEQITIIELTIDPEVKYRGLYYRTKHLAEAANMTMTDFCKLGADSEGEMDEKKFIKGHMAIGEGKHDQFGKFHDCENSKKVDVSGRDITHCDGVDVALGLTRAVDWSYEEIRDKVKALDEQRDKDFATNGALEVLAEIFERAKGVALISEEGEDKTKLEEIKRRRSSIIQAEILHDFQRLSSKDDEEINRLRSSLIMTGQIMEDE